MSTVCIKNANFDKNECDFIIYTCLLFTYFSFVDP